MLLRASGESRGSEVDLSAVNGKGPEGSGVAHAAELIAFTEAVMGSDAAALSAARTALRAVLTPAAFVDACAIIGAFNVVDRVADATGIPLDDPIELTTRELRRELELARFASSANTPGGS